MATNYSDAVITVRDGSSTTNTIVQVVSGSAAAVSSANIGAFVLGTLVNFQDSVGNAAVRADGSRINANDVIDSRNNVAAAKRDDDSPILTVRSTTIVSATTGYTVTFDISADEVVPTLNDGASYSLDTINRQGASVDPANLSEPVVMGSTTRAQITYMVTFNNEADASTVSAFVLNRAADQLLDLSWNQPANAQGTAIADGGQVAIVRTDDTPPQIIGVSPVSSIAPVAGLDEYQITLDITANEPIRIPANSIVPMSVDNLNVPTLLTSGFALLSSTNSENSVRYVFRITPPTNAAARRAIRGYTLGTRVDIRISDRAGNLTDVISSGSGLFQGALGNQIQLMDRTAPTLNVVADPIVTETDDLTYSGSFTVSGPTGEFITNINTTASYRLLRVPFANGAAGTAEPISSGRISVGRPLSADSDQVVLNFAGATLADIAEAQATFGFTIGLDPDASSRLSDPYGNLLNLDTGINNDVADARAPIERIITVVADEATATPSEDNPNEYMGSFTVTADVDVPTISATSSYTLLRINDDDTESLVPANEVQINTSATQLNREVIVSFATSQNEITVTRATQGFTLGVVDGAFSNTRDISGRLDPRDAAVAARDTDGPQLMVMTSPAVDTSEEGASTISYNMSFEVSADEPVKDIDSTASYILLVVPSTTTDISLTVTTMTVSAAGANAMTATVNVDASIAAIYEDDVEGFTLGYRLTTATELTLNDLAGNPPVNMSGDALADGDRLDESNRAEASTNPVMIECASFYPNIGQSQLFFRVTSLNDINTDGLTLMGISSIPTVVQQLGDTNEDGVSILEVTLDSEITDDMLSVSYLSAEPEAMPAEATCMASLMADIDGDNLIDIVDSNPFDPNVTTPIADTFTSQRVNTPSELNEYYNRDVIIRSLLTGDAFEPFEYVVVASTSTRPMRSTFDSGISIADYLGVDISGNTKFFRVSEGSDCEEIIDTAYANQLGNVKLDEFCDGIDDGIDFTTAEVGSAQYAWVDVADGRLQISSTTMPIIHTLRVLPEINFAGQSSYLFTSQTTKSVTISAYVGNTGLVSADLSVEVYSYGGPTSSPEYLPDDNLELLGSADPQIISSSYDIAMRSGLPRSGETILYWLEGNSNVWSPVSTPLSVRTGGYDNVSNTMYAIGGNNNIAVRVADATNPTEQITRIRQILLYEHSGSTLTRVSSMVAGRSYVVVADIDTNLDQIDPVLSIQMMDGYTIDESTATIAALEEMLRNEDELSSSTDLGLIRLTVNSDITTTSLVIGWDSMDSMASVQDITADYLVFPTQPAGYDDPDVDGDNVPAMIGSNLIDIYPTSSTRLQVTIAGNSEDVDYVRAHDGDINGGQLSMFLTDTGLAIADAQAGDMMPDAEDYSAANIKYNETVINALRLLDIRPESTTAIYSIATFGVSDVEYGFEYDDESGTITEILGGTVYVTFPIDNLGSEGETLYVGKYNSEDEVWQRFGTMGTEQHVDTWYAIERDRLLECPQDIETYRNRHTGTDDGGFIASADNCIMLVITDGHPLHDESSRDGRVIDPLSIGPVQFAGDPMDDDMMDDDMMDDDMMDDDMMDDDMMDDDMMDDDMMDDDSTPDTPISSISCAAFYPNIGQSTLYFMLNQLEAGGTFEIDGETIDAEMVRRDPLSVSLEDEIVSQTTISVKYTVSGEESETVCMPSLTQDSDRDSIVDIVDSGPFDGNVTTPTAETFASQRVDTPSELDDYYNRDVIIRSLLEGNAFESFTYVVADDDSTSTPTRSTFDSGISNADYLGVDTSGNTKFFRISEDSDCEEILVAAYANQLGNVKLDEFCEGIDDEIDFTTAELGSARYAWVDVANGRLQLQPNEDRDEPIIHELSVLPEINFSGQSSYLFASPTTKSVTISAYVGDDLSVGSVDLSLVAYSHDDENRREDNLMLSRSAEITEIISTSYDIAMRNGPPDAGETILYWLMGNSNVWSPANTPLSVRSGGHDVSNTMYAIGGNNNIAVRVADIEDGEIITRIRQILLYEHSGSALTRVSSMVADRTYIVVADIDTNVDRDQITPVIATQLVDGYEIDQSMENVVALEEMIREEGDLKNSKQDLGFIQLTVNSDITETRLVTVGWSSIAGIPDGVTADYLVSLTQPAAYAETDADGDNVPNMTDSYPADATRLQVTIGRNTGGVNFVRSHDGSVNDDQLPMFLTHTGLAIADGAQETEMLNAEHYSAANIKYGEISTDTKSLLEIVDPESTTAIYSVATFGVSDVEYGFNYDNETTGRMLTDTDILGGTIYVTFPIDNLGSEGETLYVGKYNSNNNRWQRFDTMGTFNTTETIYMDRWYAIERGDTSMACPQIEEIYRNHPTRTETDDGGFIASANNCIMLVITDGHPRHDESSRDGRVIDPISIGPVQFEEATRDTVPTPPVVVPDDDLDPEPSRRRGGGAIGAGDVLLLLTALTLLIASIVRRRRQPTTPIS